MWLQMMKTWVAFGLVFFGLTGCTTLNASPGEQVVVADQYLLTIPSNWHAEKVGGVEDFEVYKIADDKGGVVLQVYFGNQSSSGLVSGQGQRIAAGSFLGVLAENESNGKWNGEALLTVNENEWPAYMHARFSDLDATQHQRALSIIKSLKASP